MRSDPGAAVDYLAHVSARIDVTGNAQFIRMIFLSLPKGYDDHACLSQHRCWCWSTVYFEPAINAAQDSICKATGPQKNGRQSQEEQNRPYQ